MVVEISTLRSRGNHRIGQETGGIRDVLLNSIALYRSVPLFNSFNTQLHLPFRVTAFDESKLRAKKCVASITTKLVEIVIFRTDLFGGLAPPHSCAWTATKATLEPSGGGRTAVSSNCRHALIDMILHGIAALCKGGPSKVRINFNCEQIFDALHRALILLCDISSTYVEKGKRPLAVQGISSSY
jgi:hypothetical protein